VKWVIEFFFGACPSVNVETVDTALATALPLKLWTIIQVPSQGRRLFQ